MESVPDSLSATEQSILISSVASSTTLPPDNSSNELPAGIETSLTKNDVPFVAALPPPDVSLTNSTSAVTAELCILANTKPITTVVVNLVLYTLVCVPAELGSAKGYYLKTFAIYFLLFTI